MKSREEIQELIEKLQKGEITLDDIPPELAQYATSEMPDLDQEFFSQLRKGHGIDDFSCPFCGKDEWNVSPLFGAMMSIRSYGPKGIHATPEVYARVECANCTYTMMFNVRKGLEKMVQRAEEQNVQVSGMREEHGTQPAHAEEDPTSPGDRRGNGQDGQEHSD